MEVTASCYLMLQKYINSKQKSSEKKDYAVCLGKILKHFAVDDLKKKNDIKRNCKTFSVGFDPIYTNYILDIHKYVMKRT